MDQQNQIYFKTGMHLNMKYEYESVVILQKKLPTQKA